MNKENNKYMSSYNLEKFKEILKFTKIENTITKPWSFHPAIPLCVFLLFCVIIVVDSLCGGFIIEKLENFINNVNESLFIVSILIIFVFIILGCFLISKFMKLKEKKFGTDIYEIKNEIFSKILNGYDAEIFLKKGLPREILDFAEECFENGDTFYSDEDFLCFRYKDILINRGLVKKYNFSLNSEKKYETWYVFKPKNEINFDFELGNNFSGKDCVLIENISSNKEFNILGEIDKIKGFLTKEKIQKLSKLDKLMNCNFSIISKKGLVVMKEYHGIICPDTLDIKYDDTAESYELKFEKEVEKMKSIVDFMIDEKNN